MLEKNQRYVKLLEELQIPHTFLTGPGSHEWDFWDAYLKKALEWLPLEGNEAGMSSGNIGA